MAKKKKKKINNGRKVFDGTRRILKWRYFFRALVSISIALVIVNHSAFTQWLGSIDWILLKDYLAILVTWPVAVLILGMIFMYKFSESIREFLRKMDRFKAPGIEVSQQQSATPPSPGDDKEQKAVEDLESKIDDGSVTLTKHQADELVELFETMEFRFLNLHLVQNTKIALQIITQSEVRKSAFLQVYQVPPQVVDQVRERQAILNSLIEAQLIYEENDLLKSTDKGGRFLTFIGMPVQQVR